jgi:hypothetical protein
MKNENYFHLVAWISFIFRYLMLLACFFLLKQNLIRFIFTEIDRENHTREFSFLLFTDNDTDMYQVDEVQPSIPTDVIDTLVQKLNDQVGVSHFGEFIRGMRQAFCNAI